MSDYHTSEHIATALCATDSACNLIELLPETDLIIELKALLNIQYDVLVHALENKHYGNAKLAFFNEYAAQILIQTQRISDGNQKERLYRGFS